MSGGVITVDMYGVVTTYNATAECMLGIPATDVQGKRHDQAFGDQRGLVNVLSRTLKGQARYSRYELEVPSASGRHLVIAVSSTLLKNREGDKIGATLFLDDLTETKRLRKEVALKERLAALGELSAGMVHEIRNPLGGIQLMAGLLKRKLPENEELGALVGDIIMEVKVLERIVAEFLDFARPPKLNITPTRIAEVVDQALGLCEDILQEKNVSVRRRFSVPKSKEYGMDGEQVKRVLLNLIRNAAQAMDPECELSISVDEATPPGMVAGTGGKTWLEIRVRNTGSFIPPELIDKIFNPFFSTKESGTGIGLAIVHKIVENHGGTVRAESDAKNGTSFQINLPTSEVATSP
jgi:PAS domain S-box-containing protein